MAKNIDIPLNLQKTIISIHKLKGQLWLKNFPQYLDFFIQKWQINNIKTFPNLSYHFVAYGIENTGREIVIKAGPPDQEFINSFFALKSYPQNISNKLIDYDLDKGFLLLEKAIPGISLKESQSDIKSTAIAIDLMKNLWQTSIPNHNFQTISHFYKSLPKYHQKYSQKKLINNDYFKKAEECFRKLIYQNKKNWKLLHGDLHNDNILSHKNSYILIDPKGIVGPPIYELGPWFFNFPTKTKLKDIQKITQQRLFQFSTNLNLNPHEIIECIFAQLVLSIYWCFEEKTKVSQEIIELLNFLFYLSKSKRS